MFEVANEILRQIGGAGRVKAMIGVTDFYADKKKDNFLGIRFQARAKAGINCIKITLNAMDLYDVDFVRVSAAELTTVSTLNGVYAEDLKRLIEAETGLYLSLN